MLVAAVATILLITCANVANLLLARGTQRNKELAVRKAIGADGRRLLRQLLTESAVLAAGGVLLGVALSTLAFAYLARLVPRTFPIGAGIAIDWRVLAFAIALVTCVTVLLFGAGPALIASRRGFNDALRAGGASVARRSGRMRNGLVIAEITLTVVLLAAAGLLLRSYAAVLAVDPGFNAEHLLLVETPLAPSKYGKIEDRTDNYRRVLERVRALPGVASAGYVNLPPLMFKGGRAYVSIEGEPPPSAGRLLALHRRGPRRGRRLSRDARRAVAPRPSVRLARRIGRRPHHHHQRRDGKAFLARPRSDRATHQDRRAASGQPWLTVIGVVGDVHQMGLDVAPEPEFFLSAAQDVMRSPFFWPGYLLVRTQTEPLALAAAVRRAVWEIDANQPVASTRTMQDVLDRDVASRNTQLTLVGAFAALALLLASVGLYGVLSYTIAQRTAEIGLRMALGAQTGNVVAGVLRGALRLASIGVVLGVAGAFGVTRFLGSFLFGVSPMDPTTLAGVAFVLVTVTIVASWLPALRAARVDPMAALRSD